MKKKYILPSQEFLFKQILSKILIQGSLATFPAINQNGPHISLTVTIYLFGLNQLVLVCASYIAQWEICTFLYVMKVSCFCNLAGIMQSSVSVVCPWQ